MKRIHSHPGFEPRWLIPFRAMIIVTLRAPTSICVLFLYALFSTCDSGRNWVYDWEIVNFIFQVNGQKLFQNFFKNVFKNSWKHFCSNKSDKLNPKKSCFIITYLSSHKPLKFDFYFYNLTAQHFNLDPSEIYRTFRHLKSGFWMSSSSQV